MNEEDLNSGKGTHYFEYGGYGHIRPEFPNYIRRQKKGLTITWYDSESEDEGETANNVMAYSRRCVSEGETNFEDMHEEELATSFRIMLSNGK